jgi:hypothetical protein
VLETKPTLTVAAVAAVLVQQVVLAAEITVAMVATVYQYLLLAHP